MKLAALAVLSACALNGPETKVIVGRLAAVERAPEYEAACSLHARFERACDTPPVCCAYLGIVQDSAAKRHYFYFFAPRGNSLPQAGWRARWRLHQLALYRFPCSAYGCAVDIAYSLLGDSDVVRLP